MLINLGSAVEAAQRMALNHSGCAHGWSKPQCRLGSMVEREFVELDTVVQFRQAVPHKARSQRPSGAAAGDRCAGGQGGYARAKNGV